VMRPLREAQRHDARAGKALEFDRRGRNQRAGRGRRRHDGHGRADASPAAFASRQSCAPEGSRRAGRTGVGGVRRWPSGSRREHRAIAPTS
jgi:hypothetical protein